MTRLRRRMASVAVATALLGGATAPALVLAPAASAHAVLLSVDPEDGAKLETSPEQVVLTFNEEVNQNFASVAVTSEEDRTNRAVGEPVVEGPNVTVQIEDLPPGAYTVGYRVTSVDGHVVGGSSVFTVAGDGSAGAPGTDAADGGDGAGAGGADESDNADSPDDTGDVSAETSGEDTGLNPAIWIVGGVAVVLIGGAFFLMRR